MKGAGITGTNTILSIFFPRYFFEDKNKLIKVCVLHHTQRHPREVVIGNPAASVNHHRSLSGVKRGGASSFTPSRRLSPDADASVTGISFPYILATTGNADTFRSTSLNLLSVTMAKFGGC